MMGEMNKLSTYTWTPDSDKMIRISKSTLDTYSNWCSQQMWLGKVCHTEPLDRDYLVIGDNVHNAQEEFYENLVCDTPRMEKAIAVAKDGDEKTAFRLLKEMYPVAEGDYADREEALQNWMIHNDVARLKHCAEPDDFLPAGNELDLDAIVEVDVPEHGIVKVHLRGIIDRIFKDENGDLILMELKTGKFNPKYTPPKMKGEMAYYTYLLDESDSDLGDVKWWAWRFPKAEHWDVLPAAKRTITAMKKRMGRLVKSYLEQDFPVVSDRQEYKCSHCDFMQFCPKWTPYENPIEVSHGADPIWKEDVEHD